MYSKQSRNESYLIRWSSPEAMRMKFIETKTLDASHNAGMMEGASHFQHQ